MIMIFSALSLACSWFEPGGPAATEECTAGALPATRPCNLPPGAALKPVGARTDQSEFSTGPSKRRRFERPQRRYLPAAGQRRDRLRDLHARSDGSCGELEC